MFCLILYQNTVAIIVAGWWVGVMQCYGICIEGVLGVGVFCS